MSANSNSYLKTESIFKSSKLINEEYTVGNCKEEPESLQLGTQIKEESVPKSSGRVSYPTDHEESIFKVENGGFYAYSGAFETFNNIVGATSSSIGGNNKHMNLLQIQTSRSFEGSQLRSDQSPS